jgi:NADPH:quinone reductase-like Zn-dependent oxidoreductase
VRRGRPPPARLSRCADATPELLWAPIPQPPWRRSRHAWSRWVNSRGGTEFEYGPGMRAVVQDGYGSADLLEVREIDTPTVADDEVLVRVRAASVHPDVWHVVSGRPYVLRLMGSGLRSPKNRVPGTDVAGHVESVGGKVTRFRPGDEVFGETVSGYQWHNGGAYADFVAVPQDALALKPGNITFEQAAAVPTSGLIALHNLPDAAGLRSGHRVLVNGAGGGVGAFAVQLAKGYGATVTGVDNAAKLDMIRSRGADRVIDYAKEDFTLSGERYDFIFDVPGNHSFRECRRALTPTGGYVLIGHDGFGDTAGRWLGSLPRALGLLAMAPFVSQLAMNFSMPSKKDSMAVLQDFLETGKLTPLVERTYSLSEVPKALRYLQEGQARGKIVIAV